MQQDETQQHKTSWDSQLIVFQSHLLSPHYTIVWTVDWPSLSLWTSKHILAPQRLKHVSRQFVGWFVRSFESFVCLWSSFSKVQVRFPWNSTQMFRTAKVRNCSEVKTKVQGQNYHHKTKSSTSIQYFHLKTKIKTLFFVLEALRIKIFVSTTLLHYHSIFKQCRRCIRHFVRYRYYSWNFNQNVCTDIGLPEVHFATSLTSDKIQDGDRQPFWKLCCEWQWSYAQPCWVSTL